MSHDVFVLQRPARSGAGGATPEEVPEAQGDGFAGVSAADWRPATVTVSGRSLEVVGRSPEPGSAQHWTLSVPLDHTVHGAVSVSVFGKAGAGTGSPRDSSGVFGRKLPDATERMTQLQDDWRGDRLRSSSNQKVNYLMQRMPADYFHSVVQGAAPHQKHSDAKDQEVLDNEAPTPETVAAVCPLRQMLQASKEEVRELVFQVAPYDCRVARLGMSRAEGNCGPPTPQSTPGLSKGVVSEDASAQLQPLPIPQPTGPSMEHVGSLDLPPIPLGRLPHTNGGLPCVAPGPGCLGSFHDEVQAKHPYTHCGLPLSDYDSSNVQPQCGLGAGVPPLPPCSGRLPHREIRPMQSRREVGDQVAAEAFAPLQYVVTLWLKNVSAAISSGLAQRLRTGDPLMICFRTHSQAKQFRDTVMETRKEVLQLALAQAEPIGPDVGPPRPPQPMSPTSPVSLPSKGSSRVSGRR